MILLFRWAQVIVWHVCCKADCSVLAARMLSLALDHSYWDSGCTAFQWLGYETCHRLCVMQNEFCVL
jgi:hypothetical protein